MREIKFRAWVGFFDGSNTRMVYDCPFRTEKRTSKNWLSKELEDCDYIGAILSTPSSGVVLDIMQYTGLKDLATKDECHGDLVRTDEGDIWRVSTDDPRGVTYINIKTGEIITAWSFLRSHVIIGNIFENPELAEAVK